MVRQAGLESPEQVGIVERHGGILKEMLHHVVVDRQLITYDQIMEGSTACVEVKNSHVRWHGFSPAQWVISRNPRVVASGVDEVPDLGAIEGANDGAAEFGMRARLRHEAQKAFVHQDSSRRVRTALLRKSAPMPGI